MLWTGPSYFTAASNSAASNYAEACEVLLGTIFALLFLGNATPFEEMSQWWRVIDNTVSDLVGQEIESQNSRSKDKRIPTRPT